MKKVLEQPYPFGSQHPSVTNARPVTNTNARRVADVLDAKERRFGGLNRKQKALHQSVKKQLKMFTGGVPAMKPSVAENKIDDRIYTMAFVKEALNLSKEEKLDLLEFVYTEPDIKRVVVVIEKYVDLDEGIWDRVTEATKQAKSLFYTNPKGKKMLKFAGKPPKDVNRQLSKVVVGEGGVFEIKKEK